MFEFLFWHLISIADRINILPCSWTIEAWCCFFFGFDFVRTKIELLLTYFYTNFMLVIIVFLRFLSDFILFCRFWIISEKWPKIREKIVKMSGIEEPGQNCTEPAQLKSRTGSHWTEPGSLKAFPLPFTLSLRVPLLSPEPRTQSPELHLPHHAHLLSLSTSHLSLFHLITIVVLLHRVSR